jgi:hypothetical protein
MTPHRREAAGFPTVLSWARSFPRPSPAPLSLALAARLARLESQQRTEYRDHRGDTGFDEIRDHSLYVLVGVRRFFDLGEPADAVPRRARILLPAHVGTRRRQGGQRLARFLGSLSHFLCNGFLYPAPQPLREVFGNSYNSGCPYARSHTVTPFVFELRSSSRCVRATKNPASFTVSRVKRFLILSVNCLPRFYPSCGPVLYSQRIDRGSWHNPNPASHETSPMRVPLRVELWVGCMRMSSLKARDNYHEMSYLVY